MPIKNFVVELTVWQELMCFCDLVENVILDENLKIYIYIYISIYQFLYVKLNTTYTGFGI